MVITNRNLQINDGVIINNGGWKSHGVAVFWKNNALHTKFVHPNGLTWEVSIISCYKNGLAETVVFPYIEDSTLSVS